MRRHGPALATVLAVASLALPVGAQAATITVNTSNDVSGAQCTLRDAIEAANANSAKGACPAGESAVTDTIAFNLPAPSTITLGTSAPSVTGATAIVGPGAAQLTISGGSGFRLLEFSGSGSVSGLTFANSTCAFACGIRNTGTLALEGVLVTHNTASASGGANIFPQSGGIENTGVMTLTLSTVSENHVTAASASNQNSPTAGGVYNGGGGKLTVDRSTIAGNTVSANAAGGVSTNATGGGISNFGMLTVERSTISGNSVTATGGANSNSAQGGGITNANAGTVKVKIDRSTISGNTVTATGNSPQATAGGFNVFGSIFTVSSSTIVGNSAPSSANVAAGALAVFKNTIVAKPVGVGPNCAGVTTSLGYNLSDTAGCGFTQPTDKPSTNPMLAATLADNGGPTRTFALLSGSPAIDQGLSSAGELVDQRGLTRPVEVPGVANAAGGDGTDIGAFEEQVPAPPVVPADPVVPGPAPPGGTADTTPPVVTIKNLKPGTYKRTLKIRFTSSEAGSTFKCKLDGKPFKPCSSPFKTKRLAFGRHKFAVVATDGAGNTGPTAKQKFKVLQRPKPAAQ
jgi:hypothetical protein